MRANMKSKNAIVYLLNDDIKDKHNFRISLNLLAKNYLNKFPYPWILVRVEDLTLRPKDTVTRMCNCAGGKVVDTFTYSVSSAKAKGGHKSSTGMLKACKSVTKREGNGGFSDRDYRIAKETIDEELLAFVVLGAHHAARRKLPEEEGGEEGGETGWRLHLM